MNAFKGRRKVFNCNRFIRSGTLGQLRSAIGIILLV